MLGLVSWSPRSLSDFKSYFLLVSRSFILGAVISLELTNLVCLAFYYLGETDSVYSSTPLTSSGWEFYTKTYDVAFYSLVICYWFCCAYPWPRSILKASFPNSVIARLLTTFRFLRLGLIEGGLASSFYKSITVILSMSTNVLLVDTYAVRLGLLIWDALAECM